MMHDAKAFSYGTFTIQTKKIKIEKFSLLVLNHGAGKMGESLQDVWRMMNPKHSTTLFE